MRSLPSRRPSHKRLTRGHALVALLLATAACTSSGPAPLAASSLRTGPCRDVTAAINEARDTVAAVRRGDVKPADAAKRFKQVQDRLTAVRDQAPTDLRTKFVAVGNQLGFYRAAVDSNTVGDNQLQAADRAVADLVAACRAT